MKNKCIWSAIVQKIYYAINSVDKLWTQSMIKPFIIQWNHCPINSYDYEMINLTFAFTFVRRMQSANEKIKLEEGR